MVNSTVELTDIIMSFPDTWVGMPDKEKCHSLSQLQRSVREAASTYSMCFQNSTRDMEKNAMCKQSC